MFNILDMFYKLTCYCPGYIGVFFGGGEVKPSSTYLGLTDYSLITPARLRRIYGVLEIEPEFCHMQGKFCTHSSIASAYMIFLNAPILFCFILIDLCFLGTIPSTAYCLLQAPCLGNHIWYWRSNWDLNYKLVLFVFKANTWTLLLSDPVHLF